MWNKKNGFYLNICIINMWNICYYCKYVITIEFKKIHKNQFCFKSETSTNHEILYINKDFSCRFASLDVQKAFDKVLSCEFFKQGGILSVFLFNLFYL